MDRAFQQSAPIHKAGGAQILNSTRSAFILINLFAILIMTSFLSTDKKKIFLYFQTQNVFFTTTYLW